MNTKELEPHLDLLTRLSRDVEDHEQASFMEGDVNGWSRTAESQAEYVHQLMAVQHRAIDLIRNELRDLAVGDPKQPLDRDRIRQRLYELNALVRSLIQQSEIVDLNPTG
jgi:hypothetical protein